MMINPICNINAFQYFPDFSILQGKASWAWKDTPPEAIIIVGRSKTIEFWFAENKFNSSNKWAVYTNKKEIELEVHMVYTSF